MVTVTIVITGQEVLGLFRNKMPSIIATAVRTTGDTEGRTLYNEINNLARVRTGRMKRGNWLEVTDTGFHFWNNVPYSKYQDTQSARGNRFMTGPYEKRKNKIIQRLDQEIKNGIVGFFASKHSI